MADQQFVRFGVCQSLLFVYWRRTTTINVFWERASSAPGVAWAAHKFNYRVERASIVGDINRDNNQASSSSRSRSSDQGRAIVNIRRRAVVLCNDFIRRSTEFDDRPPGTCSRTNYTLAGSLTDGGRHVARLGRPDKLASRTERRRWWIVGAEAGGGVPDRPPTRYPALHAPVGGQSVRLGHGWATSICELSTVDH